MDQRHTFPKQLKLVFCIVQFIFLTFLLLLLFHSQKTGVSLDIHYEYEYEGGRKVAGPLSPLMQQDSAQL